MPEPKLLRDFLGDPTSRIKCPTVAQEMLFGAKGRLFQLRQRTRRRRRSTARKRAARRPIITSLSAPDRCSSPTRSSKTSISYFGASAGAVIGLAELRALWWTSRAWRRWCLRCDPLEVIGAFSAAVLEAAGAAGADWSVWARTTIGDNAMAAPRPIAAIFLSMSFSPGSTDCVRTAPNCQIQHELGMNGRGTGMPVLRTSRRIFTLRFGPVSEQTTSPFGKVLSLHGRARLVCRAARWAMRYMAPLFGHKPPRANSAPELVRGSASVRAEGSFI